MGVVVVEDDLRREQLGPRLGVDDAGHARPWLRWNSFTAPSVIGPKMPSFVTRSCELDRGDRLTGVAVGQQPGLLAADHGAAGRSPSWSLPASPSSPTPTSAATAPGRRGWPRRRPASRPSGAGRCAVRRACVPAAGATVAASAPTARRRRDRVRFAGTDPARMDVSPRSVLPSFFPCLRGELTGSRGEAALRRRHDGDSPLRPLAAAVGPPARAPGRARVRPDGT